MPTFSFDKVEGTEAEITTDTTRLVRMGTVDDIDLQPGASDPEALLNVVGATGFPNMRSPLSANYSWLILLRVRVLGSSAMGPRKVRVALEYGREESEFTPTVYIVSDDTYVTQVTSPKIPGLNQMIRCEFDSDLGGDFVTADLIFGTFFRPARAIAISVLRYGRPTGGFQSKVGYVNDAEWPTSGVDVPSPLPIPDQPQTINTNSADPLPRAYWMLGRYRTQWNRQGFTTIEAQAISRVFEDWSEIFTLQNKQTGKYPFGELTESQQQGILEPIMEAEYIHGKINAPDNGNYGIIRVGPAPLTSFPDIFGF